MTHTACKRTIRQPMQPLLTSRRPTPWIASCLALWLAALLWSPACLAAPSRIVEQAFVLDPSGQMTLDQARQQPETAYSGNLTRFMDSSVVWVRLRVVPSAGATPPAPERLRVVPIWSESLLLYDPLRRDAIGALERLDTPPAAPIFTVQTLPMEASAQARDLWLRLDPGGPIYLTTAVLTLEEAANQRVSDGIMTGIVIGAKALLILLGFIVWLVDRRGIGHTLFTKQVVNLSLAVLNADLLSLPVLPSAPHWPEGTGSFVMEGLRLLNVAVSLWFFIKVLEQLQTPPWALKLQRIPLILLAVCWLLLLSGQLAQARTVALALQLVVPLGLVVASLACPREPRDPATGLVLGLTWRSAERLAFGLVLWTAWATSFSSGLYKTQDIYFFATIGPVSVLSTVGVLFVVGWWRTHADRKRKLEQRHRAEMDALALDYERGERQRQQEFMDMLTHELKAPLSTLAMVIGSPTPSSSMKRHAELALSSMRQVIDHCAQSANIDDSSTQPQQAACALAVELEQRVDAWADKAKIQIATEHAMPPILADRRMLTVILNNLLDNALKYSPPGSAIRAAIVREIHPQGAIQKLSVTNPVLPGPLPDAKVLFSKYYRGEAVQHISGSGLGLHLSRLLARRQGGDLLYQADAQGITFTLVMPESPLEAVAPV